MTSQQKFCVKRQRYKRNAVIGDLHRLKRISSNFEMEIKVIRRKF